jgi:Ni/Co efflux regulator RcnB
MKKMIVVIAAVLALSAPLAVHAADHDSMPMDHGSMNMDHGSMKMEHGAHKMGNVAHEEVVDGVKATYMIMDIKAKMKEMGMKETHHLMVEFTDAKSGKNLSEGTVTIKIMAPDKSEQTKELMAMPGMEGMGAGFGSDLAMPKKGKYGVMTVK